MKNECKSELIEGLKDSVDGGNNILFTTSEDNKSLLQQKEKLDRLFSMYKQELEQNINVTNNFPIAFRHVREVQHEFQCLLKYSLEERCTNLLITKTIYIRNTKLTYNEKGLREYTECQKLKCSVCEQIIDFIVLKSCLLKELKDEYFKQPISLRNKIKWNGTKIEFLEMVQFLQEAKIISKDNGTLTFKEAVYAISSIFNININDIYSKLGKQRQRKNGHGTIWYQILTTYQQNKK